MEDIINSQNGDLNKIQVIVHRILSRAINEENHMISSSPSIYMAPDVLRHLSPSSFSPSMVSIGPLHREDENVQAFEMQKGYYLMNLMKRMRPSQDEILKSCMQNAYLLMDKIKASYVWTKTYSDAEIAEMMVMDACFILEFLYQYSTSEWKSYLRSALQLKNLLHDLLLLENQIPFFFLHKIFQCTIFKFATDASLDKLIRPILLFINPFPLHNYRDVSFINNPPHILSLLHQCYKPPTRIMSESPDTIIQSVVDSDLPDTTIQAVVDSDLPDTTIQAVVDSDLPDTTTQSDVDPDLQDTTIQSVVDLERAGVNFKPYRNKKWVIGMEVILSSLLSSVGFWGKLTFKLPVLLVSDRTELVLRNLIAYEQSFQTSNYITSYVVAMNMLVRTQEDVAKLVQSSVLINYLGTNEEVANLINNISKEVATDEFYYDYEFKALNRYWDTNIAWVRRTYFIGPWNIISLLAGIILFFLTVVQTIFTIKPFGSNN